MSVNEKMTAIADAIRSKTGGTEALTLDRMAEEIAGIETGGGVEVFENPNNGTLYTAHMDTSNATLGWTSGLYWNCEELVTFRTDAPPTNQYQMANLFRGCKKLETVVLTRCTQPMGGNTCTFSGCTSLREVTFGGIGYPVTGLSGAEAGTNSVVTLTIYVNAATLEEATAVGNMSFINATIIYRNSTTGEVITE